MHAISPLGKNMATAGETFDLAIKSITKSFLEYYLE